MELIVSQIKKQDICVTNYDELYEEISQNLKKYEGLILTDENTAEIKNVKANLNKLIKAIDRERIDKTKEYNEPLQKFIDQCNTLKNKVLEVSNTLDAQLKEAEEKEKKEKLEGIIEIFERKNEYKGLIDFNKIFQKEWLNKSYTIAKIENDMDHIFSRTKMDLETLDSTFSDEELLKHAKKFYFDNIQESGVLSLTINEINKFKEFGATIKSCVLEECASTEENKTNNKKVGRVFSVICTQEQLIQLNNFLAQNKIETELIRRFDVEEVGLNEC